MLAFEFDRARIRQQFNIYQKALLLVSLFFLVCGGLWFAYRIHHRFWASDLAAVLVLVTACASSSAISRQHDLLMRCWKRSGPALVVNANGIIVNALNQPSGQITWQDIEKMYPMELKERLFRSTWEKMPMLSKQRGLAIILKTGTDFQRSYRDSGIWKVHWLFIPELLLTTTADDVMIRLNEFYIAQAIKAQ